jgi:hypothetical protein
MGVFRGGQPGADVQELPHPPLGGQVTHGTPQKSTIRAYAVTQARQQPLELVAGRPVGGEVVLAAQPVVVATSRVRHRAVDRREAHAGPQ